MGRKFRTKERNLERKIIRYGTPLILCLWAVSFFAKISLSSINIEVEKIKSQVKTQTEANQGLTMKINELASLENVNEVANNTGLAYNNSNIRIVNNR